VFVKKAQSKSSQMAKFRPIWSHCQGFYCIDSLSPRLLMKMSFFG
jgi:hypothetical protein